MKAKRQYGVTFTSDDGPNSRMFETKVSADGFHVQEGLVIFWVGGWWDRRNVAAFTKSSLRCATEKPRS